MFNFLSRKKQGEGFDVPSEELLNCDQIGLVAGEIWRLLDEQGETGLSELVLQVDFPRDLVMQGIGWLAREDKIQINGHQQSIVLTGDERVCAA